MSASLGTEVEVLELLDHLPALYGPYIMGMLAGSVLAGVFFNQVLHFSLFPGKNRLFHKIVITGLVLVSLAALANNAVVCWQSFIQIPYKLVHNPEAVLDGKGPGNYVIVASAPGAASVLSEVFFLDRVYRLSGKKILSSVLLALCLLHASSWITVTTLTAIPTFRPAPDGLISGTLEHVSAASLWTSSVVDIGLTASLVWLLAHSKEGFNRETDSVLQYCLRVSLVTGAITSFAATVTAIALVASAHTYSGQNAYVAFTLVLPHLVACSVAGTLNFRENLRAVKSRGTAAVTSGPSVDGKGPLSLITSVSSQHQSSSSISSGASPTSTTARFAPWVISPSAGSGMETVLIRQPIPRTAKSEGWHRGMSAENRV